MTKLRKLAVLWASLVLTGGLAARASDASPAPEAVVALLEGRPVVSEKNLSDYSATQACYGEGALTSRKAAFMRLLEAAIAEEAMRVHDGPALAKGDLEREAERIDQETRSPLIIACIKKYFAATPKDYLRSYVRLVWVESRFRSFLASDPHVQARAHRQVQAALERVRRGDSLEAAAGELGLAYSSAAYSLAPSSGTPAAPDLARYGSRGPSDEAEFIREHLADLTAGQVKASPVETDFDLHLLRLLNVNGSRWTFESVSARKDGQADWFQTLPKMKLSVLDLPLRLWISGLKGNPRLAVASLID